MITTPGINIGVTDHDGKSIIVINPSTEGWLTWFTGAGDDLTAIAPATGRGTGQPFHIEVLGTAIQAGGAAGATVVKEFDFLEPIELHDGQIVWNPVANWGPADTFSIGAKIPANVVVANATNQGNCNKVAIGGGANIIVPAMGDGAYDIDLTTATPTPSSDATGYWDVEYDTGAVSPSATPGSANWILVDFPVLSWLLRNIMTAHSLGVFDIDAYKTEYLHHNWKLVWSVTKKSPGDGTISAWLFCFRRKVQ